jgi:hypothetical protein
MVPSVDCLELPDHIIRHIVNLRDVTVANGMLEFLYFWTNALRFTVVDPSPCPLHSTEDLQRSDEATASVQHHGSHYI